MLVDTIVEDDRWAETDLPALAETAATTVLDHLGLDPGAHEIALLACDDTRIGALNAQFRGKPRPTNVLSWPAEDLAPDIAGAPPLSPGPGELGDIAIAWDTCVREARAADKPLGAHLRHLVIHATLHLLGYDHETEEDAHLMEAIEVDVLGKLGDPSPY